jgi:hypothetical protein
LYCPCTALRASDPTGKTTAFILGTIMGTRVTLETTIPELLQEKVQFAAERTRGRFDAMVLDFGETIFVSVVRGPEGAR